MKTLLILILLGQAPTLYRVTEKNGLKYEVTSFESDGPCYVFRRPNGEVTRWFKDRIVSIEKIDLTGVVPSPPPPPVPEVPRGRKVPVPDRETRLVPGKLYVLYRYGEPDLLPVEATFSLWNWVSLQHTNNMSEEAVEAVRINAHVVQVPSGTTVALVRLSDPRHEADPDFHFAMVKALDGPCKGKILFLDRSYVVSCHWEIR